VDQTTVSITESEAKFEVSNSTLQDITGELQLYFPVGEPKNHYVLNKKDLLMELKLVSVSPSTGSLAGSTIIAQVEGATTSTTDLVLKD